MYRFRYKEAYSDEKHLHIVMELCELGDLHGLLQETRVRNDRLSDPEVMDYFVHICLALEYIHSQRILHRDLKTKNIFLKKGNLVKLGQFPQYRLPLATSDPAKRLNYNYNSHFSFR